MFGKAKAVSFNYVIAVKDYAKTIEAIKDGSLYVPFDKEIYSKLFKSEGARADNMKELGKFIKICQKDKKDVNHYWEGLISEGYTLIGVRYDEKTPPFEKVCSNDAIKFVCTV